MKKKFLFITLITAVSFSACTTPSQKNTETKQTDAIKDDHHNHNDSSIKKTDSLGMKMGGNELDSKKK